MTEKESESDEERTKKSLMTTLSKDKSGRQKSRRISPGKNNLLLFKNPFIMGLWK